jgi:hypothetical protein
MMWMGWNGRKLSLLERAVSLSVGRVRDRTAVVDRAEQKQHGDLLTWNWTGVLRAGSDVGLVGL